MNENEINIIVSFYLKINIHKLKLIKDLKIIYNSWAIFIYTKNEIFRIFKDLGIEVYFKNYNRRTDIKKIYLNKNERIYYNNEILFINNNVHIYYYLNYNIKKTLLFYDDLPIKTYNYIYISDSIIIQIYENKNDYFDDFDENYKKDYYSKLDDKIYFINNYKLYFFI